MVKDPRLRRRRVLQGAGAGGATLLAGCANLGSDDDAGDDGTEPDDTDGTDDTGDDADDADPDQIDSPDGDEREVGLVIAPSEEEELELGEIQQRMQELQMEMVEGGDEEEIEAEMQELQEQQEDIIENAIAVAAATVSEETDATVDEEIPAAGGLQVSGAATDLLDLLLADSVAAIVPVEDMQAPEQPAP